MAIRTISNTGGDWNDPLAWVGGVIPTSADDVVATATSGDINIVGAASSCRSVDLSLFTGTVNNWGDWYIYGGMTLGPNMAMNQSTYMPTIFMATDDNGGAGWPVITAGNTIPVLFEFRGAGGLWKLQDEFYSNASISVTHGTLNTNGQTVRATAFDISGDDSGLILGNSTITCEANNWRVIDTAALDCGTSTIIMSGTNGGTIYFYGGGHTYSNLQLTGVGQIYTVTDDNTFNNLTISNSPSRVNFTDGGTTTILGTCDLAGRSNALKLTIRAISTGSITFSKANGRVVGNWLALTKVIATGGAEWYATNSTNSGGNTGWTFGTPPAATPSFTGSSTGTTASTAVLLVPPVALMVGNSLGTSATTAWLTRLSAALAGSTVGTVTTTAWLTRLSAALGGTVTGTTATTGTVSGPAPALMVGTSTGTGVTAGLLSGGSASAALFGTSTGTTAVTAVLTHVAAVLRGSSTGTSTTTGAVTAKAAAQLLGNSTGTSNPVGTLTTYRLRGAIVGTSDLSGALTRVVTYSLWTPSTVPTTPDSGPDNSPVELGVKFKSDISGTITGIRFYKASGNTGTHTGHLWTSAGTLLGTATFSGETGSGWQQADFATPISIVANTTYVASYHTTAGHYSTGSLVAGVNNPPLHAPADGGVDGGNGVFAYGAAGTFPTESFQSSHYFVDVVLKTATGQQILLIGTASGAASGKIALSLSTAPTPTKDLGTATSKGSTLGSVGLTTKATLSGHIVGTSNALIGVTAAGVRSALYIKAYNQFYEVPIFYRRANGTWVPLPLSVVAP